MMPAYSRSQRAAAGRALATAALLVATACGVDRVTAPVTRPFVPTLAADAAGVPTAGLGGAWTISPVDAHQFYAQAQQPTGIVLPAGIPVRIVGSGLITKTQTPGVQQFCAAYPTICNGDYQKLILGPALPVYGDTSWFGDWRGAASLSWNGATDPISFGLGNHVIEMTWPGGEMWAGHAYWECYYQDYATMSEEAPCFDMGGAWTIAVVPNDGSEVDTTSGAISGGTAKLVATLESSSPGADGMVDVVASASATTGDGLTNPRWYFVPDATQLEPPLATRAFGRSGTAPAQAAANAPTSMLNGVLATAPAAGPARAAAPASAAPAPTGIARTAAEPRTLDECNSNPRCVTSLPDVPGKLIVVATVGGTELSAEAKTGDGGGLRVFCLQPQIPHGGTETCRAELRPANGFHVDRVTAELPEGQIIPVSDGIDIGKGKGYEIVGEAVASTHLTVYISFDDNGTRRQLSGTASFAVIPRAWPVYHFTELPKYAGNGEMSPEPPLGAPAVPWKLGYWAFRGPDFNKVGVARADAGPNRGVAYLSEPPQMQRPNVYINDALHGVGAWYADQNGVTGGKTVAPNGLPYCTSSGVDLLRMISERHEGLTGDPLSHHMLQDKAFGDRKLHEQLAGFYVFSPDDRAVRQRAVDFYDQWETVIEITVHQPFDAREYPQIWDMLGCELDFHYWDD